MGTNPPDRRVAGEPLVHTAVCVDQSANPPDSPQPVVAPVPVQQTVHPAPNESTSAKADNGSTPEAKSADPETTPASLPEPPASGSDALWLVITLLNLILIVFLLPADLLKNEQVTFMVKTVSIIAAMGTFAAGLVWFKNLLKTLPRQKWFRVLNVIALCLLIPAHVSQMPVVPVRARIEPATAKLLVDGVERNHENGKVRLSISNHKIEITPREAEGVKPGKFTVSYRDVMLAIFGKYAPRWSPLYQVTIDTNSPDVEVVIRKKDGEFDRDYRKDPPATELKQPFEPLPNAADTLVYRGGSNSTGSSDHIDLPFGEYELTSRRERCDQTQVKHLSVGKSREQRTVSFDELCAET